MTDTCHSGTACRLHGAPHLHVTEVLQDLGFIDTKYFTEQARSRGEVVHYVLAGLLRGQVLDWADLHQDLHGYVQSGLRLIDQEKPDVLAVEEALTDPRYRIAGTLDLRLNWRGKPWVWDFKTGKAPAWGKWQTAGYTRMLRPDGIAPFYRACVELHADGSPARVVEYSPLDTFQHEAEFLAMATTVHLRRYHHAIDPRG